ncbi:uncharacterized protein LOC131947319 [Physella acuta]|uniref:uncharacterized protein LOC131947319 n=1 Tax=Physella acuta TaxID=109671 RepID=UPI0027DE8D42|nr:uncharacterized protein LOC131947319 [Physella acuta]XP_059164498.1 uncharacterized protein LOC131947319 [Physella acuta]
MAPRIQIKLVGEHVAYLEEQIRDMEPALEIMKRVVEKSKAWIQDKNDTPSVPYIEICQELESATTAMLDAASHIINKNKEQVDAKEGTPFLSLSTQQTTATETPGKCESEIQNQQQIEILSRLKLIETAISSLQDFSRLELIETALSFVHDDNDKSTEDISEIKQWRDNFVTEQSDMRLKIEQMTKKQNQDFKNLRKQMSEQDNKVKELNKEIESLKETETKSNKTLEKLSLDMKEYENILLKINKEIQDHSDKTDSIT